MFPNFFRKKVSIDDIAAGLQVQEEVFDRRVAELSYDRKQVQRQLERAIKKGVDGAASGSHFAKQEAAIELKAAKLEGSQLDQDLASAVKAKALVRVARRKLVRFSSQDLKKAYEKVVDLFDNSAVKELMARTDLSTQDFERRINIELDRALAGFKTKDEFVDDLDTSLFDKIYEATQKGDTKQVADYMREATGQPSKVNDHLENI